MEASRIEPRRSPREHEARLLSVMLRTSRLTWLFAASGADRTALLKTGVMPMMQRRCSDRGSAGVMRASPPAGGERRSRAVGATARRGEIAIYFDDWNDKPLSRLKAHIGQALPRAQAEAIHADQRLAAVLQQVNAALGLQFVFVLNDFDTLLGQLHDQVEVSACVDELIDAMLLPGLAASFLICLPEESKARLERFRGRLPGFDDSVLRLLPDSGRAGAAAMPMAAQANAATDSRLPHGPSMAPRRLNPRQRESIKLEEVYALIEATLTRTASQPTTGDWKPPPNADESADGDNLTPGLDEPAAETPSRNRHAKPRFADALRRFGRRSGK